MCGGLPLKWSAMFEIICSTVGSLGNYIKSFPSDDIINNIGCWLLFITLLFLAPHVYYKSCTFMDFHTLHITSLTRYLIYLKVISTQFIICRNVPSKLCNWFPCNVNAIISRWKCFSSFFSTMTLYLGKWEHKKKTSI